MMKSCISLFFLLPLVTGCALLPDLGAMPEPSPPAQMESLADGKAGWPSAAWWQAYNDPQLSALIEEGLKNAPSIEEASARLRRADALVTQARAGYFPTVDAEGSVQKVKQSYNNGIPAAFVPQGFQPTAQARLTAAYDLDLWGRTRAMVAAATSEAEAARLDSAHAQITVATAVAGAYADLAQLYAERDAAAEAVTVRRKSADLFQERVTNGLENKGSYDQSDAAAAAAEADLAALDESIGLARNALAALLGAGPDRGLNLARPSIQVPASLGLPENLPLNLIGRRPDIQAMRLHSKALARQLDIAETAFYPNINLMGYIGHQSLGLDTFTDHGSLIGAFGPAISLPLFEGGSLRGRYREARADYDISVAQYNAALVQAMREVADAVTSQKALQIRLQKTQDALAASERAYQVANNRYRGGLSTYLDVLRAEDALIANRRALAVLRSRAFTLDVAMVRALGGGFGHPGTPSSVSNDKATQE